MSLSSFEMLPPPSLECLEVIILVGGLDSDF